MLDARSEISNLRQRLKMKNLSDAIIDSICNEASLDIGNATADILADAMSEAVQAGADVGSSEFISELQAVRSGPSFELATSSGRTDFSEAPFPQLPRLLKNAKVAKDGSLYKVIPLKKTSPVSRTAATTEAALENINNARRIAKEQRDNRAESGRSLGNMDVMSGMDSFMAMQSINQSRSKEPRGTASKGGAVDFRTASSKQDASTQWVMPGKNRDVSKPLREINMNMHDNIDRVIEDIIRSHEDGY